MTTYLLTGMPDERRAVAKVFPGATIFCGTDKLSLLTLLPADATRIVNLGVCGGLAPDFNVGDVAVAAKLIDPSVASPYQPDAAWGARVAAALGVSPCVYYSSNAMDEADSAAQRVALFAKTGARAIDDETHYVAAAAAARGIAWNTLRTGSDGGCDTLPLAATGAIMNADGSANLDYLLRALATEPAWQTLDLGKVALDYASALAALQKALVAARDAILA